MSLRGVLDFFCTLLFLVCTVLIQNLTMWSDLDEAYSLTYNVHHGFSSAFRAGEKKTKKIRSRTNHPKQRATSKQPDSSTTPTPRLDPFPLPRPISYLISHFSACITFFLSFLLSSFFDICYALDILSACGDYTNTVIWLHPNSQRKLYKLSEELG